jgi:hypothetical protein
MYFCPREHPISLHLNRNCCHVHVLSHMVNYYSKQSGVSNVHLIHISKYIKHNKNILSHMLFSIQFLINCYKIINTKSM